MPAENGPKSRLRLPRAAYFPLLGALLLAGIPLGIVAFTDVEPRERPIFPFDATISNPNNKTTISAIDFLCPGFVFALILLAVTEFFFMHPQLSRQHQIDNYAQSVVYLLTGFLAHICIQQLSSVLAGKPRPNFLEVCKPNLGASASLSSSEASPDGASPAFPQSITVEDCTDGRDMADYLRSFPSGHASAAMFLSLYPVIYLLYTRLLRQEANRSSQSTSRLIWDARTATMTCFNGFVFALAWYVGLSRYIDNKHAVEDIVAGWLLGIVFAVWAAVECFIAQRGISACHAEELRIALGHNSHELQTLGDPAVSLTLPPHAA